MPARSARLTEHFRVRNITDTPFAFGCPRVCQQWRRGDKEYYQTIGTFAPTAEPLLGVIKAHHLKVGSVANARRWDATSNFGRKLVSKI